MVNHKPQPIFLNRITKKPLEYDPDMDACVYIQYSGDWFVRTELYEKEKLFILNNGKKVPLLYDDLLKGYRLEDNSKKQKELRDEIIGSSGLIQLYVSSTGEGDAGRTIFPSLWTIPGSLSEEDYRELLDQLKTLAVRIGGSVRELVSVSETICDRKNNWLALSKHEQLAEYIVYLIGDVAMLWPLIKNNPSNEITQRSSAVRFDQPGAYRSEKTISQTVKHPDRTYISVLIPDSTFDTQENRFLAYLFQDIVLRFGDMILNELHNRMRSLNRKIENPVLLPKDIPHRLNKRFLTRLQDQQKRLKGKCEYLRKLSSDLQAAQNKVKAYLSEPFIAAAVPNRRPPERPSQKLIQSIMYRSIYQRYAVLTRAINFKGVLNNIAAYEQLELKSVRPLPELYEIWLFLEIYRILTEDFNFRPVNLPPADYLITKTDGIELTKNHTFRLEFSDSTSQFSEMICQVDLIYEPIWQPKPCEKGKGCFNQKVCPSLPCYQKIMVNKDWAAKLTPDIGLIVRANKKEYRFAIDAKYRSYNDQLANPKESKLYGYDHPFSIDVLGIAKMKYLNALDLHGAFIVHTDLNNQWNFWGGEPFTETPVRERSLLKDAFWPGHKFGAIYATPLIPDNIQTLLKCILMYHAGLYNICWRCGKRLTVLNKGATPGDCPVKGSWTDQEIVERVESGMYSVAAVYYQCPDCGEFWILQRCYGRRHPIVKFGVSSFHTLSKTHPNDLWLNICPQCGSDLPEDFQKSILVEP